MTGRMTDLVSLVKYIKGWATMITSEYTASKCTWKTCEKEGIPCRVSGRALSLCDAHWRFAEYLRDNPDASVVYFWNHVTVDEASV